MTSRELFKQEWLIVNDWDQEVFEESNFTEYPDLWFDAFLEMYKYLNSLPDKPKSNIRYLMQNPQEEMMNDKQWNTLSWNISWTHADMATKNSTN